MTSIPHSHLLLTTKECVDYEGMRYTVGELFCDGIYSIEEVERYIVCYLMARSEHDDSKLYWQMVDKSQLNEETEAIIQI